MGKKRIVYERGPKGRVRFGDGVIKRARDRRLWTQDDVADQDNISIDTVRRAEKGVKVSLESAHQLIAILALAGDDIPFELRGFERVYHVPGGRFEKVGNEWIEFKGETPYATFQEYSGDQNEIVIADHSRLFEGRAMLVRIPASGGTISWSYENPIVWKPFTVGRRFS